MEVSRVHDCVAWKCQEYMTVKCQEFMTVLHGSVKVCDCVSVAWKCQEFMTIIHGSIKSS